MLSEQSIITQLQHAFPQDIGDDAAVFKAFGAQSYVITKDLLIENIHFRTQYVNPTALAHKAIHVNLSDIAAMGAKPLFVLLGLSFPKNKEEYIKSFLEYFAQVCQKESITLLGGDTTASPEMIYLSITAVGIAETVRVKYRHTARAGDCIAATGTLGEAYLGLLACEQGCKELTDYKKIFLEPTARIAEGLWLAQHDTVHALMDVSDGLYADLKKLCAASKVAAEIRLEQLSYSENFSRACQQLDCEPIATLLCGGEDYGLLMTCPQEHYKDLASKFHTQFGYPLRHLGEIKQGHGVRFTQQGIEQPLVLNPFTHFGESL